MPKLVGFIILISAATPALAETNYRPYPYGAPGDAGVTEHCSDGSYIMGVHASKGAWINKLGLICARVSPYARVLGPDTLLPMFGSRPGGDDHTYRCGTNQVLVDLLVVATESKKQVAQVLFACASISGPFNLQWFDGPMGMGSTNHSTVLGLKAGTLSNDQPCKRGEAGYAIAFRYGQDVNALGLVCRAFANATPPDPHAGYGPPPPPRGTPVNAGDPIKTTGKTATSSSVRLADVLSDSTVYKSHSGSNQPDNVTCQVRQGDVVAVDVLGPDNWMHFPNIQNGVCGGQSGWVWNAGEIRLR